MSIFVSAFCCCFLSSAGQAETTPVVNIGVGSGSGSTKGSTINNPIVTEVDWKAVHSAVRWKKVRRGGFFWGGRRWRLAKRGWRVEAVLRVPPSLLPSLPPPLHPPNPQTAAVRGYRKDHNNPFTRKLCRCRERKLPASHRCTEWAWGPGHLAGKERGGGQRAGEKV